MTPTEIYDINKAHNGFKSVRVIEPPWINCWKKGFLVFNFLLLGPLLLLGPPGSNSATLGKEIAVRSTINSQTIPEDYAAASRRVEDLGWKLLLMNLQLLMPPLATPIDGRLGKLKRNLVVQDENDTSSEGSDEIDGEELEITTPIKKIRIQSTSLSPVQASTTTHEVIRPPQPPEPPIRSPTRPSTLFSTSTNILPPVAGTSRDPMSPEPESIFDNH
ncbi:hypothetical protein O181_053063 [Austropuccinia psidii MF-1]|uniref:Uncharacterized protein n=1 Tax=Austropuccinia psidii MF-1 TaxID=1389203 RepID=A0A9Q3E3S6_9BASI|nr:hypothetical protein [Austropuccinia psidii MF-1]